MCFFSFKYWLAIKIFDDDFFNHNWKLYSHCWMSSECVFPQQWNSILHLCSHGMDRHPCMKWEPAVYIQYVMLKHVNYGSLYYFQTVHHQPVIIFVIEIKTFVIHLHQIGNSPSLSTVVSLTLSHLLNFWLIKGAACCNTECHNIFDVAAPLQSL